MVDPKKRKLPLRCISTAVAVILIASPFSVSDLAAASTVVTQTPGDEEQRLREQNQKLETLVKALTHENEVLRRKLKECSDKAKGSP